jgi:hypothetical protein
VPLFLVMDELRTMNAAAQPALARESERLAAIAGAIGKARARVFRVGECCLWDVVPSRLLSRLIGYKASRSVVNGALVY